MAALTPQSQPGSNEERLDEVLRTAFVGLYMRTPEGEFAPVYDKHHVLYDSLKTELQALLDTREAAAAIATTNKLKVWLKPRLKALRAELAGEQSVGLTYAEDQFRQAMAALAHRDNQEGKGK
jgi:hypothetical protein